jgi:hypothetical protein
MTTQSRFTDGVRFAQTSDGQGNGIRCGMRILKGFGKYSVFLMLNGVGGMIAATILTVMIVNNFAWILGQPKTGSAYGNVVELISWGLWGPVGAVVAVEGYSKIFKQFPARWMGITTVSILLFGWILTTFDIIFDLFNGEIELDPYKAFAHQVPALAKPPSTDRGVGTWRVPFLKITGLDHAWHAATSLGDTADEHPVRVGLQDNSHRSRVRVLPIGALSWTVASRLLPKRSSREAM